MRQTGADREVGVQPLRASLALVRGWPRAGEEGWVEIESEWTGRKRERMGIVPRVKLVSDPVSFGESS